MKPTRALFVAWFLGLAACASGVGTWPASANTYDMKRATLATSVQQSLAAQHWMVLPSSEEADLLVKKMNPGGSESIAHFRFFDNDPGSSFEIRGLSDHDYNWLTFGILGLSHQHDAQAEIDSWLQEWNRDHVPVRGASRYQ